MKTAPAVGTRVRLTGDFLRSTGQMAGGEGLSRWVVVDCSCGLCRSGDYVATNEGTKDNCNNQRHINVHNLEKCR